MKWRHTCRLPHPGLTKEYRAIPARGAITTATLEAAPTETIAGMAAPASQRGWPLNRRVLSVVNSFEELQRFVPTP